MPIFGIKIIMRVMLNTFAEPTNFFLYFTGLGDATEKCYDWTKVVLSTEECEIYRIRFTMYNGTDLIKRTKLSMLFITFILSFYIVMNNFYCLTLTELPMRDHLGMDFVQDQSDDTMVQQQFIVKTL